MKMITTILVTLFTAAIIASAKSIIDVEVIKAENINIKQHLIDAKSDRSIIKKDIKDILKKL